MFNVCFLRQYKKAYSVAMNSNLVDNWWCPLLTVLVLQRNNSDFIFNFFPCDEIIIVSGLLFRTTFFQAAIYINRQRRTTPGWNVRTLQSHTKAESHFAQPSQFSGQQKTLSWNDTPNKLNIRIDALCLFIASTASSCVAKSTSASPDGRPSLLYWMLTLTKFNGKKNYNSIML